MNFGYRYHLASLMAVFFSLILGILIGGALLPDHSLVEEQALLLSELEERFYQVQANLGTLHAQAEFSTFAWGQLRDTLVKNRLDGKTVVLLDIEERAEGEGLAKIFGSSGAEVKKIRLETMTSMIPTEDMFFVFQLSKTPPSEVQLGEIYGLAEMGAQLSFVWNGWEDPPLEGLPPSLQVDGIDTYFGEIALILGLHAGTKGRFGVQGSAERLFP